MVKKIVCVKTLVSIAVFLLLAGIFATGQPIKAKEKEFLLIRAFPAEGLDPVAANNSAGAMHGVGAVEYLFRISKDGKVEPELAESFRSINPNTWEVKLRPNVTFWSGKVVDANVVKASLERSRKLSPQAETTLSGVRIEMVDTSTLHFVTETPNPFLPYNIATTSSLAIHNADAYGDELNPFDLEAVDTTGFFRVLQFDSDQLILTRWDGYWGRKPKFDRVIYRSVSDPQSRLIEILSGKPHLITNVPTEGTSLVEKNENMDLVKIKDSSIISLYLNTRSPELQDARARQALGWAINRQEVINLGYAGIGEPAPSWYASNAAYPEAMEMGYTRYDPERAGQLLDEAGWLMDESGVRKKNGQSLQLKCITYGSHKAALEAMQSQLKKIGVQVDIQHSNDWGFVVSYKQDGGQWHASLEWQGSAGLNSLWRHFAPDGEVNYSHYDDAIMNQLIETVGKTFDEEQRHKLILEANARIFEIATLIPVAGPYRLHAVNKNLQGYVPAPLSPWQYLISPDLEIKE